MLIHAHRGLLKNNADKEIYELLLPLFMYELVTGVSACFSKNTCTTFLDKVTYGIVAYSRTITIERKH